MVKQRRRQCVFRNLLSKCKVDSEGGKVGMTLFGHLVGTRGGGGGKLNTNFKGIWFYSSFWSFLFYEGKKVELRF